MGADFRDVGNDGLPDIFVTGMNGDTFPLFHNDGTVFSDITATSGVAKATLRRTAWGNGMVDFDNDGYKDLFTAKGSILDNSEEAERLPSKQPNHRGVAFGDLNNDGSQRSA